MKSQSNRAVLRNIAHSVTDAFPSGYDCVRVASALLLLVAAGLKTYQLSTEPVIGTGLIKSRPFLIATVEFELLLGIALLLSPFGRGARGEGLTWLVALTCFSAFACVSLYKALSGYATCGCFGSVKVNPWYTTALDLAVVVSLLRWRDKGLSDLKFREQLVRTVCVLPVWFAVGVPAAYAMASYANSTLSDAGKILGDGRTVVLEPESWIGKRFPLLRYIEISDDLKQGRWVVLLYHHDCPKCRAVIQELDEITCEFRVQQVASVEMAPYAAAGEEVSAPAGNQLVRGRLSSVPEWFAETPIGILLDMGVVIDVVNSRVFSQGRG